MPLWIDSGHQQVVRSDCRIAQASSWQSAALGPSFTKFCSILILSVLWARRPAAVGCKSCKSCVCCRNDAAAEPNSLDATRRFAYRHCVLGGPTPPRDRSSESRFEEAILFPLAATPKAQSLIPYCRGNNRDGAGLLRPNERCRAANRLYVGPLAPHHY
jgi:hypothetical protein